MIVPYRYAATPALIAPGRVAAVIVLYCDAPAPALIAPGRVAAPPR